jgi:uridine kinase
VFRNPYAPLVTRSVWLERREAVALITDSVLGAICSHPVRTAIDGPDAAGKTTLADELAAALQERGRSVIRASIDGFHRPRRERYRRGSESPLGYYEDSFDYRRLREELLDHLGEGGDRCYCARVFDHLRDKPVQPVWLKAPPDAILLFDGVFLHRPELADAWDFSIFVSVSPEEIIRRARTRDSALFGSDAETERRYRTRYLPGQRHYLQAVHPEELANIAIDNEDPSRPSLRIPH